ncbi:MAG: alpha-hydroxy acid oxidase [Acidimicrobiia bacterium]
MAAPPPKRSRFGSLRLLRFRRLELRPLQRRLSRGVSVADLRSIAKRRLPRGVFDYIDGGAEDEVALTANSEAYRRVTFRPRVLRDMGQVDTSSTLLGKPLPMPLVLAPTGFTRIADPAGELAVARAAARAGIPYTLSTLGTRSIEEVAAVGSGRLWFQVYVWKDRGLVAEMVQRAADSGYEALCLTVDTAVLGKRERDVRRGFTLPPKLGLSTLIDGMIHPGWTWQFVRSDPILFANVAGRGVGDGADAISLAEYVGRQFDPGLSWRDVEWLRGQWDGPIVLKGIQTVEDAVIAADEGIEAIALSNHGGRQLDSAPAPLDLLPEVADLVGDRTEIICDGGVRRGSDIVKALALGARASMAGRAYLYGLGAAGESGVDHVIDLLSSDMRRTMALIGCPTVDALGPEFVDLGTSATRRWSHPGGQRLPSVTAHQQDGDGEQEQADQGDHPVVGRLVDDTGSDTRQGAGAPGDRVDPSL